MLELYVSEVQGPRLLSTFDNVKALQAFVRDSAHRYDQVHLYVKSNRLVPFRIYVSLEEAGRLDKPAHLVDA